MAQIKKLKDKLTIVVVGPSGSGKGTQAKFILKKLGASAHHIETGKILRSFIKKSNPTADIIRRVLTEGMFAPSWAVSFLWLKELVEKKTSGKHLVFDGSPRTLSEAKMLDDVIEWYGRLKPICIYIDVASAVATKRLLARHRIDDTLSVIKNRLKSFLYHTIPVVNHYKKEGRLIRIDGNWPPEKVWEELDNGLKKRLGKLWP